VTPARSRPQASTATTKIDYWAPGGNKALKLMSYLTGKHGFVENAGS